MNKTVLCPECGCEMGLYGIFEDGALKFWCSACSRVLSDVESHKLGVDIKDINV